MTKSIQRALLLALAGLASALFANATTKLEMEIGWFYPGIVFGIAIAAVFVLQSGVRSPAKLIAFVAASTVAYPVSIWSAMVTFVLGKNYFGPQTGGRQDMPMPVFFIAGSVGALIVYLAALVLFGPKKSSWRSIVRPFCWSLIGGVLGVIGSVLSASAQSARVQDNGEAFQDAVLSAIWQTGVALCIVFVVPAEEDRGAPTAESSGQRRS
jgi:hypothetical protein